MDTNSSQTSTTIKIYKEDVHQLAGDIEPFDDDPSGVPKVCRMGRVVENINVLMPWRLRFPIYVEPKSIDTQRGIGPILSQLPGEIRNIIYSHLLSDGHPQFLQASRALNKEGSGLLAANGIYRISFGFYDRINYSLPSQRIVDTIRNLDICVHLSHCEDTCLLNGDLSDLWQLEAFGGSGLVRGQCNVCFEIYPSTTHKYLASICSPLRLLSDFEKVVVRAKFNWPEPVSTVNGSFGPVLVTASAAWSKLSKMVPFPWSEFQVSYFYDILGLDWSLGFGRLERDELGPQLIFHPRKALEGVDKV